MNENLCPICFGTCTGIEMECGILLNCKCNSNFNYSFTVSEDFNNCIDEEKSKRYNLIAEKLLRTPYKIIDGRKLKWFFYYNKKQPSNESNDFTHVNIAKSMLDYPKNFSDKLNRILLNLSVKYPKSYQSFSSTNDNIRLFFGESMNGEIAQKEAHANLKLLADMEFVKKDDNKGEYSISAKGYERIAYLIENEQAKNQGFIAMEFSANTQGIRECFRKSIQDECGYNMISIDEKEHNNQIVPEIFHEIKMSKFMVVDVTYPNYGAYYEAGYAQGLGKEVIVCCNKETFDTKSKNEKPHFDISQKSMIIWENDDDLTQKLAKRIKATVGEMH